MKVKEESEKVGLKLNIQKTKIMASGPFGAAAAKSLQSCPTLCDPINGSPPGSLIPELKLMTTKLSTPSLMLDQYSGDKTTHIIKESCFAG